MYKRITKRFQRVRFSENPTTKANSAEQGGKDGIGVDKDKGIGPTRSDKTEKEVHPASAARVQKVSDEVDQLLHDTNMDSVASVVDNGARNPEGDSPIDLEDIVDEVEAAAAAEIANDEELMEDVLGTDTSDWDSAVDEEDEGGGGGATALDSGCENEESDWDEGDTEVEEVTRGREMAVQDEQSAPAATSRGVTERSLEESDWDGDEDSGEVESVPVKEKASSTTGTPTENSWDTDMSLESLSSTLISEPNQRGSGTESRVNEIRVVPNDTQKTVPAVSGSSSIRGTSTQPPLRRPPPRVPKFMGDSARTRDGLAAAQRNIVLSVLEGKGLEQESPLPVAEKRTQLTLDTRVGAESTQVPATSSNVAVTNEPPKSVPSRGTESEDSWCSGSSQSDVSILSKGSISEVAEKACESTVNQTSVRVPASKAPERPSARLSNQVPVDSDSTNIQKTVVREAAANNVEKKVEKSAEKTVAPKRERAMPNVSKKEKTVPVDFKKEQAELSESRSSDVAQPERVPASTDVHAPPRDLSTEASQTSSAQSRDVVPAKDPIPVVTLKDVELQVHAVRVAATRAAREEGNTMLRYANTILRAIECNALQNDDAVCARIVAALRDSAYALNKWAGKSSSKKSWCRKAYDVKLKGLCNRVQGEAETVVAAASRRGADLILEDELHILRTRVAGLRASDDTVTALRDALSSEQERVGQLLSEISKLEAEKVAAESQEASMSVRLRLSSDLEKEVVKLRAQLKEAVEKASSFPSVVASAAAEKARADSAEAEAASSRRSLKEAEAQASAAAVKLREMRERAAEAVTEATTLREQLKVANDNLSALSDVKARASESTLRVDSLQREMLLLRSEVDSAKAEAAAAVEEVKRVEELRKADQSLISSAAASKREAEEVQRRGEEGIREAQLAKEAVAHMQDQLDRVIAARAADAEKVSEGERAVAKAASAIADTADLKREVEVLRARLEQKAEAAAAREREVQSLSSSLDVAAKNEAIVCELRSRIRDLEAKATINSREHDEKLASMVASHKEELRIMKEAHMEQMESTKLEMRSKVNAEVVKATQEREALRVDYEARLSATEADVAAATIELKQLRDAAATAEAAAMAERAAAIAEEEARRAKFAEWQLDGGGAHGERVSGWGEVYARASALERDVLALAHAVPSAQILQ